MVSQYNRNLNGGSNHSVNIQKYVDATRTSWHKAHAMVRSLSSV